jgi:hypothetical protein
MGYRVVKYQETPNPNALKAYLDRRTGSAVRSYFKAQDAAGDPMAAALFAVPGVTNVLINGDWVTVSKRPEASWGEVKRGVEAALGAVE